MTRWRLAKLIWRVWRRRNYYKTMYEYERDENNVWMKHFRGEDNG